MLTYKLCVVQIRLLSLKKPTHQTQPLAQAASHKSSKSKISHQMMQMIHCIAKSTHNIPPQYHHWELRICVCRRGMPISQEFTLAANRSEHIDSPVDDVSGDRFTNMSVFESPPRHGYARLKKTQLNSDNIITRAH
jgi:hypothetical protein